MKANMMRTILNEKEAAYYIGMSVSYLRQDRMNGTIGNRTPGPSYIKIGKSVRYKLSDLEGWIEEHRISR